jgi:hypothetical protein
VDDWWMFELVYNRWVELCSPSVGLFFNFLPDDLLTPS